MTRTFLLLLLMAPLANIQAQKMPVEPDARLYAAFDSAYLERLKTDNPALLLRWNYYLDNAFIISDFPAAKGEITQYPEVQVPDIANVNILVLEKTQSLHRDWRKPTFYRIGDTGKVLMYYSGEDFNRKFRKWIEDSSSRE